MFTSVLLRFVFDLCVCVCLESILPWPLAQFWFNSDLLFLYFIWWRDHFLSPCTTRLPQPVKAHSPPSVLMSLSCVCCRWGCSERRVQNAGHVSVLCSQQSQDGPSSHQPQQEEAQRGPSRRRHRLQQRAREHGQDEPAVCHTVVSVSD